MELAQSKGAKGILYYDDKNYARYKGYYDYMKTNDSGRMEIKGNEENPALILMGEDMAKALLPDGDGKMMSKTLPISLGLNLKSANEEVKSENVVAVLKGTEKSDEYIVISSHLDHIGVTKDGQINNGADEH